MYCFSIIQKISHFFAQLRYMHFKKKLLEFKIRDTIVVGCSTNTEETHMAWLNTPKDNAGIYGVTFPLMATVQKLLQLFTVFWVENMRFMQK